VYVQDKPVCTAWNEGLATLGIQNFTRNKAAFPAGKNASKWGSTGMNEAYRFLPSAGVARFKKAELLQNGAVVALADTASGSNGELNLSFGNVCPASDSTQYLLRVSYGSCSSTEIVSFEDSVTVKKEKLAVQLQVQDPTCAAGGSFTVNAEGTASSFLYSLNGAPAQSSNTFSDLQSGDYEISVSSPTCTKTATATLRLQNDLTLTVPTDTSICAGQTVTPQISSNGASFAWSPAAGLSNASEIMPAITADHSTTYTITATKGSCQQTAVMKVTVKPLPVVNAGPDQAIIQGDVAQLAATASAGTYNWSPSTDLSSPSVLNPIVTPVTTSTYRLTVTSNGCSASDDVTINVAPYCVSPMEAFSPNGDGINDRWLVTKGYCLRQAKVEIFNRYGAMVYANEDYKNDWDGTYKGKPLADGTYYFLITYQLINGKKVFVKGNVTILR